MKTVLQSYIYHLDHIRKLRKLTVVDICDGVCSDRQYRRYLSGERTIREDILFAMIEKLKMRRVDFFESYFSEDQNEFNEVYRLYSLVYNKQYEQYTRHNKSFDKYHFIGSVNKLLYDYTLIRYQYETNKITLLFALEQLSHLIDYPKITSSSIFNQVEILVLSMIANLEYKQSKKTALLTLYRILMEEDTVESKSSKNNITPLIYAVVSRLFGMHNDIDKAREIAYKGISYCIRTGDNKSLPYLYYTASFASYKLNNIDEAYQLGTKCIATTISTGDTKRQTFFTTLLSTDFGVDFKEIIIKEVNQI